MANYAVMYQTLPTTLCTLHNTCTVQLRIYKHNTQTHCIQQWFKYHLISQMSWQSVLNVGTVLCDDHHCLPPTLSWKMHSRRCTSYQVSYTPLHRKSLACRRPQREKKEHMDHVRDTERESSMWVSGCLLAERFLVIRGESCPHCIARADS